ncbi:8305_t:CDS:2 [Paraglomus brasilianum]|uniref:8305_t:CDS:1 n=1 Tax=Paraglomus brasilianum TaxID=144538 RepID=A0A9N8W7F9_9GLOM|nr:8305_t:CDS:2 [Paraglomus brasilianum]
MPSESEAVLNSRDGNRTILTLPNELLIESTNPVTLDEEDDNDEFFRQFRTVNHQTSASDESDEVVRYLVLENIGLNDDPLKWWQNHKNSLLVLAQLAREFLQLQSLVRDYSQMLGII